MFGWRVFGSLKMDMYRAATITAYITRNDKRHTTYMYTISTMATFQGTFRNKMADNPSAFNSHGKMSNPHLYKLEEDIFYHIGFNTKEHDLKKMFRDVKFVCFGGTVKRMKGFAKYVQTELNKLEEVNLDLEDFSEKSERFAIFKVGPVLSISHGVGMPSFSIVFEEIVKVMNHAKCEDVVYIRIGTSGGIGVDPGTVVITEKAFNEQAKPISEKFVLGEKKEFETDVDKDLVEELYSRKKESDLFKTKKGATIGANDFYEGQGRLDGAFCQHSENDKMRWLQKLSTEHGVTNFEMECNGFMTWCKRANVKGIVCCVTLIDRLQGDAVKTDRETLDKWETYPQILVTRFIKERLKKEPLYKFNNQSI